MITKSENRKPLTENLELLKSCRQDLVETEINDDFGWYRRYLLNRNDDEIRLAFDLEYLKKYVHDGAKVCDVGAAPFLLPQAMHKSLFKVSAVDINPKRFNGIEKLDFEIIKCDIENEALSVPSAEYDAIIFNEIIEHCRIDLITTVRELHRTLKPRGFLFMSTPNLKSLNGIYKFLFKSKAYSCASELYDEWYKLKDLGHMGHVREYTPQELIRFFEKCNFEIVELIYRGRATKKGFIKSRLFNLMLLIFPRLRSSFSLILRKK